VPLEPLGLSALCALGARAQAARPYHRKSTALYCVKMNVAVLGLGYIGLPTAAMLANAGHTVVGVDVDQRLLDLIRCGCSHVTESDVQNAAASAVQGGKLTVASSLPASADAYIMCVPTPTREHKADLRYVEQAAASVASHAKEGDLIVLESTVPPGTVENTIVRALEMSGKSPDRFYIAHCPERVIPGRIVEELRHNARVIGGRRPVDAERAKALYASFCEGEICLTDCTTAELVKIVENTFRDVNLAFANELALLAEVLSVDVWEVIRLANEHPRVNVLQPGPGVGGHCIPVDPHFLSAANPFVTELIQTARRVNERMPHVVMRMIDEMLYPVRSSAKVALLGAAYKAEIDDTRESPAGAVLALLEEHRHSVAVYDPFAKRFAVPLAGSIEEAVDGADAIVLITDHRMFSSIDPNAIALRVRRKNIVDTRNVLDREAWAAAGFAVRTLGIPPKSVALETFRTA
jgi:UDP-N-acetyl-D-mannosaminuronic acid dehydrogenase